MAPFFIAEYAIKFQTVSQSVPEWLGLSRRWALVILSLIKPVSRGLSFRIGGDEFVTLFEGEEKEALLWGLELFHMAGAQAEVNGQPVTFSYGVASYDPALDKGSLHNTLSRADALMYRFKKAARGEN